MVLTGIAISYLLGSIPTAYIVGRFFKGIDIRKFGSGNVGATNAFRILGLAWGILVLLIDVSKGIISVTILADNFLTYWIYSPLALRILFGFVCICGHNWTLFLGFKGGKGVATTLGVIGGLGFTVVELRVILLLVLIVWLLTFLIYRVVSVASVFCAISLPIFVLIFYPVKEVLVLSIILAIFIIVRHKKNLADLVSGKEPTLKMKHS